MSSNQRGTITMIPQTQQPQPPQQQQQVPAPPLPSTVQQQQATAVTSGTANAIAIPLYDLFLDLPHPCASSSCPKPFIIESPLQASGDIAKELYKNLLQIVRFAFPDYDESVDTGNDATANSILNRYDVYAMQSKSFMSFTFSLQLSSGVRVHGHVRRYLPPHLQARTRYDVGRRGERALCILTRASGADYLYASILKTVEAISSQQAALSASKMPHKGEPQKYFLFQLTRYQQHLASLYGTKPGMERGKPLIAALPCIEIGDEYTSLYKETDVIRFIIPTSLLQSNQQQHQPLPSTAMLTYNGSILPIFRCVGVVHAIRILTALLCERRVIFVSSSPTRLAACSNSALAMLSCGLLHWQHLYIPVLPPHLWQYLAAPYPYLIGVLSSAMHKLDRTDGLGEVLIINLDTNQLETRGMEPATIPSRLPDLFRSAITSSQDMIQQQLVGNAAASAPEQLAQDLFEILRNDKKILYGLSGTNYAVNVVGETASKATTAVKNTFLKLRDKSRQYLAQQKSNVSNNDSSMNISTGTGIDSTGDDSAVSGGSDGPPTPENSMASDYIYTEGCHNDVCEEDSRVAFTTFFLCLIGDLRWYLSASTPNSLPTLDRAKFLQQKRALGEGEGTAIFPLLQNFMQTQMLEEFAKARIEDSVMSQQPASQDTPLFLQCTAYHRQNHIDFSLFNVKRIVRQIADSNTSGSRLTGLLKSNARRNAMALTSNKGYEGTNDPSTVIAQLVEECRESTSILFDVMSVIWFRLRDSKGMQWKHGLQALQLLRSLLLHGPLAAISEAVDGLDKIRALKYYENIRPVSVLQIRAAASSVYGLLVDRAKLFQIRRSCIERRRQLLAPGTTKQLLREPRIRIGVPFRNIHAIMHPNAAHGTVVQLPSIPPVAQTIVRDNNPSKGPTQPTQSQQGVVDFFGDSTPSNTQPSRKQTAGSDAANDILGLFDTMTVSAPAPAAASAGNASNPFDAFVVPASTSMPHGQPTTIPVGQSSLQTQTTSTPITLQNSLSAPPSFAQKPNPNQGGLPQQNFPQQLSQFNGRSQQPAPAQTSHFAGPPAFATGPIPNQQPTQQNMTQPRPQQQPHPNYTGQIQQGISSQLQPPIPNQPFQAQPYPGSAMPQQFPGAAGPPQQYPGSTGQPQQYPGSTGQPQQYPGMSSAGAGYGMPPQQQYQHPANGTVPANYAQGAPAQYQKRPASQFDPFAKK